MRLAIGSKRQEKCVIKVAGLVAEVERKWIRNIYLRISPTDARIRISAPMTMSEEAIKRFILLYVREGATTERRAEVLREWYRAELKTLLTELIGKWEEVIGVKANRTTIKQMKTIWGSCNHRTHNINFNLELMKRPVHCIEYVVVHELLHIIVRLHNDQFKSLLTHYLPNWRIIKGELNKLYI